ncbi:hypothetical protein U1Q18_044796 [Sarracenia purpurea var. burkii]
MAQARSSRVRTHRQAGLVQSKLDNIDEASFSASEHTSFLAPESGFARRQPPGNGLDADGRRTITIEMPRTAEWRKTVSLSLSAAKILWLDQ